MSSARASWASWLTPWAVGPVRDAGGRGPRQGESELPAMLHCWGRHHGYLHLSFPWGSWGSGSWCFASTVFVAFDSFMIDYLSCGFGAWLQPWGRPNPLVGLGAQLPESHQLMFGTARCQTLSICVSLLLSVIIIIICEKGPASWGFPTFRLGIRKLLALVMQSCSHQPAALLERVRRRSWPNSWALLVVSCWLPAVVELARGGAQEQGQRVG